MITFHTAVAVLADWSCLAAPAPALVAILTAGSSWRLTARSGKGLEKGSYSSVGKPRKSDQAVSCSHIYYPTDACCAWEVVVN